MRPQPFDVGTNPLARVAVPQPPLRRPRNREATIRAVLESAQRLFTTKGFDNTSLVDIAAETGLSPRGVILHFSSKADIVAELMIRDMRARAQAYREEGTAHADAITRLNHFFAWLAEGDRRMFINFPALWAFAARWSPKIERIAEQVTAELLAPARMAIDTGIATGQLRNVDAATACEMLWNAYLAGLRRATVQGGKPADALSHVDRAIGLLKA